MATTLMLGVLILAYGVFSHSRVGLYAGLAVTAAGVLVGVVQMLTRRGD
jgi:hypothetical protein